MEALYDCGETEKSNPVTYGGSIMLIIKNEKGIALVTALMFTLITLGIIMALMQFLLLETRTSASQKRYRSSLEASYGGAELMTKEFIPRIFTNNTTGMSSIADFSKGPYLVSKLTKPWDPSWSKTTNPKDAPDMQFHLRGPSASEGYNIFGKITDSVLGNSDTSGIDYLDAGVGVAGAGSGIAPKHNPTLLTIEVLGEMAGGTKEKALLSVLYAY